MVNYCSNSLEVKGDYTELKKFYDENFDEEEVLQFCKSVPMPKEEANNWYYWQVQNWGTTEDIGCLSYKLEENHTSFHLKITTVVCPPHVWLKTVCGLYPKLSFELRFADGDVSGFMLCKDGEVVLENQGANGDFYGWKTCENCGEVVYYEDTQDDWDETLCVCVTCWDDASAVIASAVRRQKVKHLPKKTALMRMGRNPILNEYLLRKVFVPRMCEIVSQIE